MFAAFAILIIFLSIPLTVFEAFQAQNTTQDPKTTIASVDCITPQPATDDTPPTDNTTSPDTDSGGNDVSQPGSGGIDESDPDTSSPDQESDDSVNNPGNVKSPKMKDPARTAKKLQKKIQKKVKQKKPVITVTVPTPRPPFIKIPAFPEGFPFTNKKMPTPTKKPRPTSPVKNLKIQKPVISIKVPTNATITPTGIISTKVKKQTKIPNAKDIQKNIKNKLKNNKTKIQQTDPCVTETPSENSGQKLLYFKAQIQANIGTTGRIVPGATVRILQNGELVEELTSNEDGWAITKLPLGTYQIEVLDPDYKPTYQDVLIAQNEKVTQGGIHIVLEPQESSNNSQPDTAAFGVTITAYVTDSPKSSVKGTKLVVSQGGSNLYSCTIEATSCSFKMPRGSYTVSASNQSYQRGSSDFTVVGTDGKEANPGNHYEIFAVYMAPYSAANPKPDQPNGAQSASVIQYNMLLDCYSDTKAAKKCTSKQKKQADLNKDGKVNQLDYNIFLKNFK